ncbi:MBL fold metallo-hydrolase [Fuscibacter oryzae]|uniref:MBL fold metallo-hydrolase n=1 Tax=Fuscibacter oryzae TaxID=2803939 RepID=A0A8J7MPD3_9RHOB|nr:MBL fold metallo-hydrolase [Fuscibacter oryzae]MBL4927942.1 MBL fold metallo-hydrolase [Fuscibacter oryzae]
MTEMQVRLIRAPNPSAMTHSGTNTWLLSKGNAVLVIDPGPDLAAHQATILAELEPGQRVEAILVTHAHLDHSALAPALSRATGAPVLALGPAGAGQSALMTRLQAQGLTGGGEGLDHAFTPDQRLIDGETLHLGGLQIEALHTPGHSANHLCFATDGLLFSGDLAMGWASSLVSPPDGDMGAYMASLRRLMARDWRQMLPGHGNVVDDPSARLQDLYRHRETREAEVLAALTPAPADAATLTRAIYRDTPPALLPAAERNVLAHLLDLADRNHITSPFPLSARSVFSLM